MHDISKGIKIMKIKWQHFLALSLLSLSTVTWAEDSNNNKNLTLENCHLNGIKSQVQCGTLQVPENYQLENGEKISVNFAVLPAIDNSKNKAPLMFLAGGPGQASVELAAHIFKGFNEIRKSHDIILVDQRGTGKSHPLECDENSTRSVYEIIPEDFSAQEIKDCLAQFKGDLSQYNSENAIRDFDAVRRALGHEKIHIYGGSYGTRAGLVYMRMFPDSLKSVVLDSVGPIEVPIGTFGQSAARSFNLLLKNCQQDPHCNEAYPALADEFKAVITRLEQAPVKLEIAHPRLGSKTDFILSRSKFISNLRMQLYSTQTRPLVPLVIHQAFLENYQPMIGLIAMSDGGMGMYVGLTFNIVCNEDLPKITEAMFSVDAKNSFGGNDSHVAWLKVCPLWPKYSVNNDFYQSVTANIPTLILSGNLDPVTPPSNGEKSAATLPNSYHLVDENSAHIVASTPCAVNIVNEFLTTLDPKNLDTECLLETKSETFMTHLNGSL
jgi:pimeloyl-ACP methyl ester carboxylesterase